MQPFCQSRLTSRPEKTAVEVKVEVVSGQKQRAQAFRLLSEYNPIWPPITHLYWVPLFHMHIDEFLITYRDYVIVNASFIF